MTLMRKWSPDLSNAPVNALQGLIGLLGQPGFESALLHHLNPVVPAASYSIYRTGPGCTPQLFMSSSLGIPDTTRSCWNAYLSGPYLQDRTFANDENPSPDTVLCHITAQEVPVVHRERVYEAHGVLERVSVVEHTESSVFAINFYRHAHQSPFSDAHLCGFETLAPALIALVKKQIAIGENPCLSGRGGIDAWRHRLIQVNQKLTARELDVCTRLLMGMTHDGIADDLNLSVPTVKTYRNRAFSRLGIHFRSELYALSIRS